jgi:hypothetical protein
MNVVKEWLKVLQQRKAFEKLPEDMDINQLHEWAHWRWYFSGRLCMITFHVNFFSETYNYLPVSLFH